MGNKKLVIGLFFMLVLCTNKAVGQDIELEAVFIHCVGRTCSGDTEYGPYRVGVTFRARNETPEWRAIGAYSATRIGVPLEYGYFKFESATGEKFRLYSRYNIRCVPPNDTIRLTCDLIEDDFDDSKIFTYTEQFKSKAEIRDCIMNSRFFYTCIEEDYDNEMCKIPFRSQEVSMKSYFIRFTIDNEIIEDYYVEGKSFIKLKTGD